MINGEKILFHEVYFPYRGEELGQYLKDRKGSVSYMMERKKDGNGREYLIFNKKSFYKICPTFQRGQIKKYFYRKIE